MRITPLFLLAFALACSSGGDTRVTPPTVATISVALSSTTATPAMQLTATATAEDAGGAVLTGQTFTWASSNPSVAIISSDGTVTAVGVGTTSVIASIGAVAGRSTLTVSAPPVTQVTVFGVARVKVGELYVYSAQAKNAAGIEVAGGPIAWTVTGPATITSAGAVTVLSSGAITVHATVDGVTGSGTLTTYDWTLSVVAGSISASLPADLPVVNKFGTAEYPILTVGCSLGATDIHVLTSGIVTQNGTIGYSFDGGAVTLGVWTEFGGFFGERFPGSNAAARALAATVAGSRLFAFAFTEFSSVVRPMAFRVTGLAPLLPQVFAGCPS